MLHGPFSWEKRLIVVLIALAILTQTAGFTNADISLPAFIIAILVLLVSIAGQQQHPNGL